MMQGMRSCVSADNTTLVLSWACPPPLAAHTSPPGVPWGRQPLQVAQSLAELLNCSGELSTFSLQLEVGVSLEFVTLQQQGSSDRSPNRAIQKHISTLLTHTKRSERAEWASLSWMRCEASPSCEMCEQALILDPISPFNQPLPRRYQTGIFLPSRPFPLRQPPSPP